MKRALAALLLFLTAIPSFALDPAERLSDPALEARARSLSKELRCPVCQSQSIDDSDAPLARDLRQTVRQRLIAGDSDEQVRAFIAARYGSYVLLDPPLQGETILLWFGPFLLLGAGAVAVALWFRRTTQGGAP